MSFNLKAFLLSAFVLPGLGQLVKGEKLKGAILIILVNIFLLAALFLVLQAVGHFVAVKATGSPDPSAIMAALKTKSPMVRWFLAAFFGIWIFGAVDAARK